MKRHLDVIYVGTQCTKESYESLRLQYEASYEGTFPFELKPPDKTPRDHAMIAKAIAEGLSLKKKLEHGGHH